MFGASDFSFPQNFPIGLTNGGRGGIILFVNSGARKQVEVLHELVAVREELFFHRRS